MFLGLLGMAFGVFLVYGAVRGLRDPDFYDRMTHSGPEALRRLGPDPGPELGHPILVLVAVMGTVVFLVGLASLR